MLLVDHLYCIRILALNLSICKLKNKACAINQFYIKHHCSRTVLLKSVRWIFTCYVIIYLFYFSLSCPCVLLLFLCSVSFTFLQDWLSNHSISSMVPSSWTKTILSPGNYFMFFDSCSWSSISYKMSHVISSSIHYNKIFCDHVL